MELHNWLIGAWYLICLIECAFIARRGYGDFKVRDVVLAPLAYIGLVAAIVTTGDPSSFRAILLFVWWGLSTCIGISKIGERETFTKVQMGVTAAFMIILGVIGVTLP